MAVIKKGDVSARVIAVQPAFDPQYGYQTEIIYQGLQNAINSVAAQSTIFGARTRVYQHEGPVYRASIIYGALQDGSNEVPVDQWERVTEYVQEDVWSNPKILALAGTATQAAAWKSQIDDWLATRPYQDPALVSNATQQAIYKLLLRGGASHELKRFVLRRRRTISIGYSAPAVANAVERIYTTGSLIAAWGIPASVASKLPEDPSTHPDDCVWAWKERQDNSIFVPAYNRVEEVKDFVFAAWSTLLYNVT